MLVFPSDPNTGDIFGQWQWDGNKWTRAGGGTFSLESLPDVAITDPFQNQALTWDAVAEKWVNTTLEANIITGLSEFVDAKINAIPTPTPALAGLTDVALNAPAWGQLLTYNGGTQRWENASTISPITVNAPAGNTAINITRSDFGTFIYGADNGNNQQFVIEDISGFIRFDVRNARMLLAQDGKSCLVIDNSGGIQINPYSQITGTGLWITGAGGGNWAQVIDTNVGGHGFWVRAGTGSSEYCALFRNKDNNANLFRLMGDGSGELGISASKLQWDATGQWGLGHAVGPPGSVRLWMKGIGDSHGLYVEGGSASLNGLAFAVWSHDNSSGFFSIRNDGLIAMLPSSPIKIYPFPVPSGSAIFDIDCRTNGTNGGNALRVQGAPNCNTCWIQGAGNTSGSMVVLRVVNSGSAGSQSNGILIDAGTSSSDSSLGCRTAAGADILQARGDRSVVMPGITYAAAGTYPALMWNAGAYGTLTYSSSSQRYKRDVRSLARNHARELVQKLRAVTFHSKCEADDPNITCYKSC